MIAERASVVFVVLAVSMMSARCARADEAPIAPILSDVEALVASLPNAGLSYVAVHADVGDAAPDAAGLVEAVVTGVTGLLTARAHTSGALPDAPSDAEGAARLGAQRGGVATVHVRLRQRARVVEAEVTLLITDRPGLAALAAPAVSVRSRRVRRLPIGAALTRYLGAPARLERGTVVARSMPLPARNYAAIAATDLDGDGRVELALVAESRVDVVQLDQTRTGGLRARRIATLDLSALPSAPAPSRRHVATAVVDAARIIVTSSAYAPAFEVRHHGGEMGVELLNDHPCPDGGYVLPDACASRASGRDFFRRELSARADGSRPPIAPAIFYARAAIELRRSDGSVRRAEVVANVRGRLSARIGEEPGALAGVGSALGMADVDADGSPELLTSKAALDGPDRLSVTRLVDSGNIAPVWESEDLEGRVFVAGAADLDDDGAVELLAIEEPSSSRAGARARLWVVR